MLLNIEGKNGVLVKRKNQSIFFFDGNKIVFLKFFFKKN